MRNLEQLKLPPEVETEIIEREVQIRRHIGVAIDIFSVDSQTREVRVRVEQKQDINGRLLNQQELIQRAKSLFAGVTGWVIRYIPLTYQPDLDQVDAQWVQDKMKHFGIRQSDIVKHMALDKSTVNLLVSGNRNLSRAQKAAFWFYFRNFELVESFVEQLEMALHIHGENIARENDRPDTL